MNPEAIARLDRLIKERQVLISSGTLREELVKFHKEFPNEDESRYDFLDAVSLYDRSAKSGIKDPQHYVELLHQFEVIERSTPELAFYIPNYMLLCARNAGSPTDEKIPKLFQEAATASLHLPDDERAEALGHLHYNVARCLHKKGRLYDALTHWQSAAAHRLMFYERIKTANESHERLLPAAQQLWKMRGDFGDFFPDLEGSESGVSLETHEGLFSEYGDVVRAASAVPKK